MKKIISMIAITISLVVNATAMEYKYGPLLAGQCTGMGNAVRQMGATDINNQCKNMIINNYAILEEDKLNYCLNVCLMQNGSKLKKRVPSPTAADIVALQLANINYALLPFKVDEITTLVDIKVGAKKEELAYYYELDMKKTKEAMEIVTINSGIKELLILSMSPSVLAEKCKGPSLDILKSGVTFKYIYNFDNKELIGDIRVSIEDCN